MLVGPYLSHPLTRYMKNARYSQKPPPLSPLTHTLFFRETPAAQLLHQETKPAIKVSGKNGQTDV